MADSFEKRKRERRKQEKRLEKESRKLEREARKRGEGSAWMGDDPFAPDGERPLGEGPAPGLSAAEDGLDRVRPSQESGPAAEPEGG